LPFPIGNHWRHIRSIPVVCQSKTDTAIPLSYIGSALRGRLQEEQRKRELTREALGMMAYRWVAKALEG
jgi:hypothetical protein